MEYLHLKQDMQFFNFEYQFTFVSFFLKKVGFKVNFVYPKTYLKETLDLENSYFY